MKTVYQLIQGIKGVEVKGNSDVVVSNLTFDSRNANSDSLFFAIMGTTVDGHIFIFCDGWSKNSEAIKAIASVLSATFM